jgi:uncharacterized protein (DUF1786 family)
VKRELKNLAWYKAHLKAASVSEERIRALLEGHSDVLY